MCYLLLVCKLLLPVGYYSYTIWPQLTFFNNSNLTPTDFTLIWSCQSRSSCCSGQRTLQLRSVTASRLSRLQRGTNLWPLPCPGSASICCLTDWLSHIFPPTAAETSSSCSAGRQCWPGTLHVHSKNIHIWYIVLANAHVSKCLLFLIKIMGIIMFGSAIKHWLNCIFEQVLNLFFLNQKSLICLKCLVFFKISFYLSLTTELMRCLMVVVIKCFQQISEGKKEKLYSLSFQLPIIHWFVW